MEDSLFFSFPLSTPLPLNYCQLLSEERKLLSCHKAAFSRFVRHIQSKSGGNYEIP